MPQIPNHNRLVTLLMMTMVAFALAIAGRAHAYIPNTHFVFEKISEQRGKPPYAVEMEVVFQLGLERMTVKEEWLVADGSSMHLQASSGRFSLHKLLHQNRVFWVDAAGNELADPVPAGYFMSHLLTRTPKTLKRYYSDWGLIPQRFLDSPRKVTDLKYAQYVAESFVHLARSGATISFRYGPLNDAPTSPGVWVEQDTFFIKKIRTPEGDTLVNEEYTQYPRGLWLPRTQTFSFGESSVALTVKQVRTISLNESYKKLLAPQWFRTHPEGKTTWPQSSIAPLVQEFYKRFR